MKNSYFKKCTSIIAVLISIFILPLSASAEEELVVDKSLVKERLEKSPNNVIFSVNGMCCRTCAIGIGNKMFDLDFIDKSTYKKGVKIDRVNGLLTVAIKSGKTPNIQSLVTAILEAGYDPATFFKLDSQNNLVSEKVVYNP